MTDLTISTAAKISFILEDAAGAEVTGLGAVFTVTISKNGGAFGASTGAKAEIGSGWYSYTLSTTETNTAGPLAIAVSGAGTVQTNLLYQIVGYVHAPASSGTDYCTLAELKVGLWPGGIAPDTTDDTALQRVIAAVSLAIDGYTGRTFYARTETHYYDTPRGNDLFIADDDLLTITTLTNGDTTVIAAASYKLYPLNSSPKYKIHLLQSSNVFWELTDDGDAESAITVAGTWGYSATTPADVKEACILQSMRIFRRKDAPFGVAGSAEMGQSIVIPKLDPDVELMLSKYKRLV